MTTPPIAWVLNLDAEEEFARGKGYTPKQRIHKIARQQAQALTGSLIQPSDLILDARNENKGVAKGMRGLAWSPTPWALKQLHTANASVPQPPAFQTLQTVNSRLFAQAVHTDAPRLPKHLEHTVQSLLTKLAQTPSQSWLLRRPYGVAGRGRLLMQGEPQSNKELRWLIASLEMAPMVMEPHVHVILEVSTCGWITRAGEVYWAAPCFQEVDSNGSWIRTLPCPVGKLTDLEVQHLHTAACDAASALIEAEYWGPFNVDAFEYESGDGEESWNTLGEINARFTMGWATAFGERGRELMLE
jgi:hypothetical protein